MAARSAASLPSHDQIVQRIYDAADHPEGLDVVLPEIATSLNGGSSVMARAQGIILANGELCHLRRGHGSRLPQMGDAAWRFSL